MRTRGGGTGSRRSPGGQLHFVSPLERLRYLKSYPIFADLPLDEVSLVAQNVEEVRFRPGEELVADQRGAGRAYILVQGSVLVEGPGPEPPRVRAGEGIGFVSLLAGQDLTQICRAETEVAALELTRDVFWDLLEDRFPIFLAVARHAATELLLHRQAIADGTVLSGAVEPPPIPPDRPIELVERLVAMRRAGTFREASLDALIELTRSFEELRLSAGTRLWRVWEPSGFTHFVISGRVRCELPDGRVFRATVGYPLGNLESQAREPRWYTAVAETNLVTFRQETDFFHDVMEDHFDLAEEFLTALARNIIGKRQARDREAAGSPTLTSP